MIAKIILSVCLVGVTTLIGAMIADRQRVRRDVFDELIKFNSEFTTDVILYRTSVAEKIRAAESLGETFQGAAEKLSAGEKFECADKRLSESERKLVSDYVNSLGTGDYRRQDECLKAFDEKLKSVYLSQKNNYQKSAKLYSRLGFACGLIVAVLLM